MGKFLWTGFLLAIKVRAIGGEEPDELLKFNTCNFNLSYRFKLHAFGSPVSDYDLSRSTVQFCNLNSEVFYLFNLRFSSLGINKVDQMEYHEIVSNILPDECVNKDILKYNIMDNYDFQFYLIQEKEALQVAMLVVLYVLAVFQMGFFVFLFSKNEREGLI